MQASPSAQRSPAPNGMGICGVCRVIYRHPPILNTRPLFPSLPLHRIPAAPPTRIPLSHFLCCLPCPRHHSTATNPLGRSACLSALLLGILWGELFFVSSV
ncbi:hypothetical protein CPAR01_01903 [Colletotrichum paranaense]|uniref:Uncharacterized protein n=1 Tax=Colletotrichum paranaense TaxID=1914294 RepID=A0ABQ9SZN8_9PEZI|nr:uncharacterized protein CPAR01_01903 [Colletotrichum paranaense]KAK1544401.1 hypothetical protein CPAR01_01903 [Colletotrichum paranaense]